MTATLRAWTERPPLRTDAQPVRFARLREPRGGDELAVDGVDTRAAADLLDRLLDGQARAAALSASDRDGLLAALHRGLWGDRIVSTLECAACGAMYDLTFELSALQRSLEGERETAQVTASRTLRAGDGRLYCLPTAEQEDHAAQLGLAEGRAFLALAIAGEGGAADPDLDLRLEALAPLIDVDLDAACAECGHPAMARFDIQSYVLQRLLDEREGVLSQVHALAGAYGWSLDEILRLPRSLRRSLAERLVDDRTALR